MSSVIAMEQRADRCAVRFDDATATAFHYVWLRDNCGCGDCRHPQAGERMLDSSAIPLDIAPVTATATADGGLLLGWADGHRTEFSGSWLRRHAYDAASVAARSRAITTWRAAGMRADRPEAVYSELMASDEKLLGWLLLLDRFGFTVVRGCPTEPGTNRLLAERVGELRNSNFGLVWDVRSEPNPDSLAYTSMKLSAHSDLVSREAQPGLQFLHCLVNDADGGDSYVVDGFAVADELRRAQPAHFDALTRITASFRYQRDDTDVEAHFPMIRLNHRGEYIEVRHSNALMAPLECHPNDVSQFYAAYQAFSRLLGSVEFEYSFRLAAGECEVFDNRRVLHGRQAFDPNSGRRHLQGCYVDTDDFRSRIKVLSRGGDFRAR